MSIGDTIEDETTKIQKYIRKMKSNEDLLQAAEIQ